MATIRELFHEIGNWHNKISVGAGVTKEILKQKSKEELQKTLEDDREKLRQLRFDLSAGKVKNVREIRNVKKEIARILTLLKISK
jgi:large subunit ribosomal protein L29